MLGALRKGDERKVLLAYLLREKTSVSNGWIVERLCMGHPGSVSRLVLAVKEDGDLLRKRDELAHILFERTESKA